MKLVVNKDMKENAYVVELQVLDVTDTDREKFSDFGEPVIDVGGLIKGQDVKQEYIALQEPVTKIEKQIATVTEKQTVKETQLVFEEDGVTPVLDEDGVTQLTKEVDVEKDVEVQKEIEVEVPVLDENGNPVTQDKLNENGERTFELVEKQTEVIYADLGKSLRKFPSEFPISRTFRVSDYGDFAERVANEYILLIQNALELAIEQLKEKEDLFSGKLEIQL